MGWGLISESRGMARPTGPPQGSAGAGPSSARHSMKCRADLLPPRTPAKKPKMEQPTMAASVDEWVEWYYLYPHNIPPAVRKTDSGRPMWVNIEAVLLGRRTGPSQTGAQRSYTTVMTELISVPGLYEGILEVGGRH